MKKVRKRKLIYRLLLFVLPLLVLSVIVGGFVLSYTNYRDFNAALNRDYQNILNISTDEIRLYMDNAQNNLEILARLLSATKLDPLEQQVALTAYNLRSTNYMSIRLFSPSKELIASTGWVRSDESPPADSELAILLGGKPIISDVMLTPEHVPYVCMGAPVLHLGKVSAILWSELNLKAVWTVIKEINIGRTGRVYMTDFDGRVVADQDMVHVIRASSIVRPEVVDELKKAVKVPFSWIEADKGTKLYSIGKAIPLTHWIIVLRQTDDEVYEYLYKNIRLASVIIASVCLIAGLVGLILVRKFLTPIHELHTHVQRLGRGELDCKIEIGSRDEIEDLSVAINDMAESIRSHIQREVETVRELAHARNLATLGAASSKVTHEVGNLLSNIEIILLKLRREQLSSIVEDAISTLEVEAGRISRFIANILQFARKPQLHLQRISMEVVIQEVLTVHDSEMQSRGIRIELDWPSDLPAVSLDASLMYQVLNNLVKNSLETATDPSLIRIEGRLEEDCLRLTLRDDGAGIEADILDHIFEPFFSTKAHKGTGLGLAICKTIVEAHLGTIECRSTPGEYTAFILRLPRVSDSLRKS